MDFELILFSLFVISAFFWFGEKSILRRFLNSDGTRPFWLEYTAGFFPVILIVFFIRSFLIEPFNIPSGSMIPTLRIGDLILVNKFEYGVRLPILHTEVLKIDRPKRGDIAVFRYPKDNSLDYIKRVIGLPGDEIIYKDKKIIVNGVLVDKQKVSDYLDPSTSRVSMQFTETLGQRNFKILNSDITPGIFLFESFIPKGSCKKVDNGLSCKIPLGHYFVMGDNRDNSSDSRFWGFVPEKNLVGRAFLVWFNLDDIISGRISRLGFMD
ncbi:MAG: signal peptidase I [Betaproteobacteria bacterium TMED156]|nr:MAG: signal peptidase I [Betaproteobacteria bacterium TMED156]|tara:strand:- start:146 stop:946 length:801 start_codon:yes stop_codon:yes gene_type:complete